MQSPAAAPSALAAGDDAGALGAYRAEAVIGIEVAPSGLHFPAIAEPTPEGTFLVVDQRIPRNVVFEVDRAGNLLWSFRGPERVSGVQRLAGGLTAVFDTLGRALLLVDADGRVVERRALGVARKIDAARVLDGGAVVAASDDGIDWLSPSGERVARIAAGQHVLIEPRDLQILSGGRLLATDVDAHRVVEFDAAGHIVWTYGEWRKPGARSGRLLCPTSAWRLSDGHTVVANSRLHHLVELDAGGEVVATLGRPRRRGHGFEGPLTTPGTVRELPGGALLVADVGGRRIVELDRDGRLLWSWGGAGVRRRLLSFPRMAQGLRDGGMLVCDSYHDRVLRLRAGEVEWAFGSGEELGADSGLEAPRCAVQMPGGRTAIADGMNGRALVLDREHRVECELTHYRVRGRAVAFGDLHQVAAYPLGGLLVVDSDANAVLVLDESGIVEREWRAADDVAFADPHHALALPDGRVIVADSGNDRIVLLDPAGRCVWRSATEGLDEPLSWPRCTGRDGGLIFVVDSDNARVVAFDGDGAERLSYGPLLVPPDAAPGAVPELRMPKWVDVTPDGRHVLADYHNSRIIVLRPRVAEHLSKGAVAWA